MIFNSLNILETPCHVWWLCEERNICFTQDLIFNISNTYFGCKMWWNSWNLNYSNVCRGVPTYWKPHFRVRGRLLYQISAWTWYGCPKNHPVPGTWWKLHFLTYTILNLVHLRWYLMISDDSGIYRSTSR